MPRPKLDIPPGVTVVSPSQIDTAEQCWRKWGFAYIMGMRDPSGRGAAFGGVVHERHEDYLEHGTVPTREETWTFRDYLTRELSSGDDSAAAVLAKTSNAQLDKQMYPGKVMLNMMPADIYPAPGTGHVEKHFVFKREPNIWYQGLIDWHLHTPAKRHLKVIDHKTSSNPQQYGLGSEAPDPEDAKPKGHMRKNKQVVIYARALLDMYQATDATPDTLDLYWSYGKSDGVAKHSYVAHTHFDNVGEVYARFENDVHPWAKEIHRLKMMGADPLTLDPNPKSCWLYNQECTHARACNLTTQQRLDTLMNDAPAGNSLVQGLLAATGGAPPNAAAAPPVPPPVAPGDAISPPEAGGPVATAPAVALPAAAPSAAPPPAAPLPPAAPPAVAAPPTGGPPAPAAAAPPVAPPSAPPAAPPVAPPAVAAPPVAAAPPAVAAVAAPQVAAPSAAQLAGVPPVPDGFWNAIAAAVVHRIIEGLKGSL